MTTTFDDRSPVVQYVGTWGQGGDPDEYRGTTTWTATVGDSARVTFTGRGISVYGAISPNTPGRGKGPVATFMVDDDPLSSTRFAGQQTDVPQRRYLMYSVNNLDYGQHLLTMVNESAEGYFFVDYIEITGADNTGGSTSASPSSSSVPPIDPTPNQAAAPSSLPPFRPVPASASIASRSSNGPASLLDPYSSTAGSPPRASDGSSPSFGPSHSLLLPPGMSSAPSTSNSLATSVSSNPSPNSSGVRLDAIIGGTIGGIAGTCTLFLIFVLCMRRRQRSIEHYGNLGSPEPDSQRVSPEPRSLPISEKSSLPAHMVEPREQGGSSSARRHAMPLGASSMRRDSETSQSISRAALPNTDGSHHSTTYATLLPQHAPSNTAIVPLTRPPNRVSADPPPQYQPPV